MVVLTGFLVKKLYSSYCLNLFILKFWIWWHVLVIPALGSLSHDRSSSLNFSRDSVSIHTSWFMKAQGASCWYWLPFPAGQLPHRFTHRWPHSLVRMEGWVAVGITCSIEVLGREGCSFHKFMRYGVFCFLLKCVFVWLLAKWLALDPEFLLSQCLACLREGGREWRQSWGDSSHRVEMVTWGNSWDQCPPAVTLQQKHLESFDTLKFFYTLQDLLDRLSYSRKYT